MSNLTREMLIDELRTEAGIQRSKFAPDCADLLEAAAAALAQPAQDPIARLLHWCGPAHTPVPHGGVAARTFAEFPKEAADAPDSYWRNGEPLYAAPQPAAPAEVAELRAENERWAKECNDRDDLACAFAAACRFIDSHVADPNLTGEMALAYEDFVTWRKHITKKGARPAAPTQADLCAQIAKNLGSGWLVVGPDGSAFQADTPHQAANAASKHRSRMLFDPSVAAEFDGLIADVRRRNEESNACLEALLGTLNCPTCGGSGHVEDAIARMGREAQPAVPAESKPVAYMCVAHCGCLWRDNGDGSMSLFGPNSKSCPSCEPLPLNRLVPVFAQPAAPAVPAGWKLMPVEPTDVILAAMQQELPEHQGTLGARILCKAQYRAAMLAAAP